MGKENDMTCHPEWEAERMALTDKLHKLEEEYSHIRSRCDEIKQKLMVTRAKMEMVYLIFGERR